MTHAKCPKCGLICTPGTARCECGQDRTIPTQDAQERGRWLRFTLRTLVVLLLLVTSAMGLWWRRQPWYCERVLVGHKAEVCSVAYSKDGSLVVTASTDGTVRIWTPTTGECRRIIDAHKTGVRSADIAPDSTRIVTVGRDGPARLWSARTGTRLREFGSAGSFVAFSPDGARVLTAGRDFDARIYEVATGECLRAVGNTDMPVVFCGRFSPDGKRIVTSSLYGSAAIWNAETSALEGSLKGDGEALWSVAFSGDGTQVVGVGNRRDVRIWDVSSGKCEHLVGADWRAMCAAFSPDGSLVATGCHDGTIRIWATATGDCLAVFGGHEGTIRSVEFSPDGTSLLTAGKDATARLWRPRRAEWRRGVFWLWEFWPTAVLVGLSVWSVVRDRRALRARTAG